MNQLHVDLAAFDEFLSSLEYEVLAQLDGTVDVVAQRFAPHDGDAEAAESDRAFGRDERDSAAAEVGTAQQANLDEHLERLRQVRDAVGLLRDAALRLREGYADVDAAQRDLGRELDELIEELRARPALEEHQ